MTYDKHYSKKTTAQTSKARADQVKNNAGGFVFQMDDWDRFDRFLILGADSGTYYVNARDHAVSNAQAAEKVIKADGPRAVQRIVEISKAGRAHKNDHALFALALAASAEDVKTRQIALAALSDVARTGTHLFQFAKYVNSQRGWGRALKKAIANWYLNKDLDRLAYQMVKYQQREGWSHRDLLRLAHPKTDNKGFNALFKYATKGEIAPNAKGMPEIVYAHEALREEGATTDMAVNFIEDLNLPHESLPSEMKTDSKVNKALLKKMPYMALIRNLARLTANGTIKPMSKEANDVVARISDEEALKKSRIHPMHLFLAYKTYSYGRGIRGDLRWTPVPQIKDALEEAFYKSFNYVEASGKNFYLGVDISGSMGSHFGDTPVTCAEAAAVLALTIAKTEPNYFVRGFNHRMVNINITAKTSLDKFRYPHWSGGGTDCAKAIQDALKNGYDVDTFVIITDNETWCGGQHVFQALKEYRNKVNPKAKMVVIGMTATNFSIADPNDAGMLDVAGFDANIPALVSEFAKD